MTTEDWQYAARKLAATDVLSWRQIAETLGVPKSTVSDHLRGSLPEMMTDGPIDNRWYVQLINPVKEVTHDNSRILFISDQHIPYHTPGLIDFLGKLKHKYQPTRIINLGDELDKHALSFHDSDPDLDSAGPELRKSLPTIKEMEKLFPVMDLIDSNHGSLAYRKAKSGGIPRAYIRPYNEVLQVGDGWKWHFDLTLKLADGQEVYVHHGKNAQAIKTAQLMGMSTVFGHYHESFGVQYYSTPSKLLWGMNCGCLIDRKSLAFAYNNNNQKRPVIGTGLLIDGKPILETMPL